MTLESGACLSPAPDLRLQHATCQLPPYSRCSSPPSSSVCRSSSSSSSPCDDRSEPCWGARAGVCAHSFIDQARARTQHARPHTQPYPHAQHGGLNTRTEHARGHTQPDTTKQTGTHTTHKRDKRDDATNLPSIIVAHATPFSRSRRPRVARHRWTYQACATSGQPSASTGPRAASVSSNPVIHPDPLPFVSCVCGGRGGLRGFVCVRACVCAAAAGARVCVCVRMHVGACPVSTHARASADTRAGKCNSHACMHSSCIHAYMHACTHACIHAYMHACMHSCIHAYTDGHASE